MQLLIFTLTNFDGYRSKYPFQKAVLANFAWDKQ